MRELLIMVLMVWCLKLVSVVHAQDNCLSPESFVCDRAQVTQYRLAIDLNSHQLKTRYDNQVSFDQEAEIAFEAYLRNINELRVCQSSLGEALTACDLDLHTNNPLGGKYFLRETVFSIFQSDGKCLRSGSREQEIIDDKGKNIARSVRGNWMFQNIEASCRSTGATAATTARNFTLRGYDPAFPSSKGYFQVIDWAESEDYDYKVSQNWARQIQMGEQTTLAVRVEDNLIKFEFSNGAFIAVDGDQDRIVESNFLSPEHFDSTQCRTNETQVGSGSDQKRARFSPRLNLSVPYNNLPVKTIKG